MNRIPDKISVVLGINNPNTLQTVTQNLPGGVPVFSTEISPFDLDVPHYWSEKEKEETLLHKWMLTAFTVFQVAMHNGVPDDYMEKYNKVFKTL